MRWIMTYKERARVKSMNRRQLVDLISDINVQKVESNYPGYFRIVDLIDIFQWERRFGPIQK